MLSIVLLSMYDFIMGAQMLINMKGGVFSSNTQNEQKPNFLCYVKFQVFYNLRISFMVIRFIF